MQTPKFPREFQRSLEDEKATEPTKPEKKTRTEPKRDFPSPYINNEGLLEWNLSIWGKRVCGST